MTTDFQSNTFAPISQKRAGRADLLILRLEKQQLNENLNLKELPNRPTQLDEPQNPDQLDNQDQLTLRGPCSTS